MKNKLNSNNNFAIFPCCHKLTREIFYNLLILSISWVTVWQCRYICMYVCPEPGDLKNYGIWLKFCIFVPWLVFQILWLGNQIIWKLLELSPVGCARLAVFHVFDNNMYCVDFRILRKIVSKRFLFSNSNS